jgi:hypothetical protein
LLLVVEVALTPQVLIRLDLDLQRYEVVIVLLAVQQVLVVGAVVPTIRGVSLRLFLVKVTLAEVRLVELINPEPVGAVLALRVQVLVDHPAPVV